MTTQLKEKQLKTLIKTSVKEVIGPELMKLRSFLVPYVSRREQEEIEKSYGRPHGRVTKSYKLES